MKRIYTIFIVAVFALLFAGCKDLNTIPVFEESESFASFPTAKFSINENSGQVVIPVEIASIDLVKTVVSYKIIDGTAKAGVDFTDTNADAVLNFDGTTRSQNIVVNIINRAGEYTGDLDFSIELQSATGLKLSLEKVCNISILDLDHPLASILGEYDATAVSSYDGTVNWTMTLYKDAKDVTVVWIYGLTDELLGDAKMFYANVNFDENGAIVGYTVPAGQVVPHSSSYSLWVVGNKAGSGSYYPNAPLSWKFENGVFTFDGDEPNSVGVLAVSPSDHSSIAGWWNRYDVPPSYTKK